jgi:phenylpyruvate tautomerase PptA (4-oxalocrotonate tautomerase family)
MQPIMLVAGVFVLSLALRTMDGAVLRKLSVLGFLTTSFLLGWIFTGSWLVGVGFVAFWLVWPWYELITRVRKIAMPEEKTLRHKSPPHRESFPGLEDMTAEIESEEYDHLDDIGREWEGSQQFFRVFHKPDERTQVAICLVEQESFAFYYLRIISRAKDGTIWTTWNYPFSLNLQLAPEWRMNRENGDKTFLQLLDSHRAFLEKWGISAQELAASEPEQLAEQLQSEQRAQIAHNVTAGILRKAPDGEIRYTWRGLLFIWLQFLRDFVRLQ